MAQELDEAWVEAAVTRYHRSQQLQKEYDARITTATVTVHSPDNLVEVTASLDGRVRRVDIVGSLAGRSNAEVSRSIEAAVSAAADAAEWAKRTTYAEIFRDYAPLGGW